MHGNFKLKDRKDDMQLISSAYDSNITLLWCKKYVCAIISTVF